MQEPTLQVQADIRLIDGLLCEHVHDDSLPYWRNVTYRVFPLCGHVCRAEYASLFSNSIILLLSRGRERGLCEGFPVHGIPTKRPLFS